MKKFILSIACSMLVSTAVFANTMEAPTVSFETVETEMITTTAEDGWWDCYEIDRQEYFNPLDGSTTTTITYRCWWVNF